MERHTNKLVLGTTIGIIERLRFWWEVTNVEAETEFAGSTPAMYTFHGMDRGSFNAFGSPLCHRAPVTRPLPWICCQAVSRKQQVAPPWEQYTNGRVKRDMEMMQCFQHDVLHTVANQSSSGDWLGPKSVRFPSALIASIQRVHGCLQTTHDQIGYKVRFATLFAIP